MTTTKAICVWLDETSDATEPAWIVSLDELDDRGQAETTRTLRAYEAEEKAMAYARHQAARRGLPLYRNPTNGPAELVESGPTA